MGKKAPKVDTPDPLEIIEAQKDANRTGVVTPFGSTTWQGDNQVTEFGPQMQGMADRMFDLGMQDSQRAPGLSELGDMGGLAGAIMGRVGERYGMGGDKPGTPKPMPDPGLPVEPPTMPPMQAQPEPPSGNIPPRSDLPGGGAPIGDGPRPYYPPLGDPRDSMRRGRRGYFDQRRLP